MADRRIALEEVRRSGAKLNELEREIKGLVKQIPLARYILSLPGTGPLSCGIFLGESGNPDYFGNPRQIIKYAGYDPKEDDSGSRVGRNPHLEKRTLALEEGSFLYGPRDRAAEFLLQGILRA